MSYVEEMKDGIWNELPRWKQALIGRKLFDELVETSASEIIADRARQNVEGGIVEQIAGRVRAQYGFGPLFWIMIGPIIQHVIRKILELWSKSK